MKKSIIGILLIIIILCSIGCVIADSGSNDGSKNIQSISKNGVSIKFPSDWGISKTSSNCSLIAISNIASIDSNGIGQVNINIEKKPVEGQFDKFVNKSYTLMSKTGEYEFTSSGQISIGPYEGLMYMYTSNNNGTIREHEAIWIDHDNEAYVILYSAPQDQFDANLKVFEYVVHNFHIN